MLSLTCHRPARSAARLHCQFVVAAQEAPPQPSPLAAASVPFHDRDVAAARRRLRCEPFVPACGAGPWNDSVDRLSFVLLNECNLAVATAILLTHGYSHPLGCFFRRTVVLASRQALRCRSRWIRGQRYPCTIAMQRCSKQSAIGTLRLTALERF